MRAIGHIACLSLAAVALYGAVAQAQPPQGPDPMAARLSAERVGGAEPGLYATDNDQSFILCAYGDKYLLRFSEAPEVFVLTVDPVALGGKLLQYDTGATALRVSVWGGVTLYTSESPGGVPATRRSDAPALAHESVSQPDLEAALTDEASHFSYADNLTLHFSVNGGNDADTRAMAFDTLANTQLGLERFLAAAPARAALASHKIDTVRLEAAARPAVTLQGRALLVGFVPQEGFSGRASSHAVAHQLGKLLAVSTPE